MQRSLDMKMIFHNGARCAVRGIRAKLNSNTRNKSKMKCRKT